VKEFFLKAPQWQCHWRQLTRKPPCCIKLNPKTHALYAAWLGLERVEHARAGRRSGSLTWNVNIGPSVRVSVLERMYVVC